MVVLALGVAGCADRQRATLADGRLSVTPGGADFKRVAVFDGRAQEFTLRNVGRSPVRVLEAWIEGAEGAYVARLASEGPAQLAPGADTRVAVTFAPRASGDLAGTLVIRSDSVAEPLVRVPLSGTGVFAIAEVHPERLDFGRIEAQAEKTLTLSLYNPSDLPVQVRPRMVGADLDEFVLAEVELAPGERRALPVTFAPGRVGRKQVALAVQPCRGCADKAVAVRAEALDRAILAEPSTLEFGPVPVDRDTTLTTVVRNVSTEPQQINGLTLAAGEAGFTTASDFPAPLVLGAGEERAVEVRYSPGHQGPALSEATFSVVSRRNPTTVVALHGFGGAPEICISPSSINWGKKPLYSKNGVTVNVKHCGSDTAGDFVLEELRFEDGADVGQFSLGNAGMPRTLKPGEETSFRVFYEPDRLGVAQATLLLRSTAFNGVAVPITLKGEAEEHAPCDVVLTPQAVDFGTVVPRRGAVLGVKVANRGADLCAVKNIRLQDDAGGAFYMPGGAIDGLIMYPGDWFSFQVAFNAPATPGDFAGMLQVEVANPATPRLLVPLTAHVQGSCLVPEPRFLDWGLARPDCPPPTRTVRLTNNCSAPVGVTDVRIGAGTTDSEFSIVRLRDTPFTLAPGDSFEVEVDYAAQVPGMNLSPLFVATNDLPRPLLVPLVGESSKRVDKTDTFIQQDGKKVDVLFVVDNTASMVEEQPRLVSAMPAFASAALGRGVDLHVGVTTTGIEPVSGTCPGGARGGEAGRLFPADNSQPRILTQATPNLGAQLQKNVQVGQCAQVEQGLEAVRRALTEPLVSSADDPRTSLPNDGNKGFLRSEAALVVVFVGDEDDHSPDSVAAYVRALQDIKGGNQPQRVTLFAIAPTDRTCSTAGGTGTRYAEGAQRTGGEVLDVCASDYAPLLQRVANRAFSPQDRFPLTEQPDVPTIEVRVDGTQVTGGWTYDAASNSVVFTTLPPAGARIEIYYRRVCP